ncbi:MAG: alanine--tRNA ligase [Saprospiraceae bacterium]|nr:alanine--tRNA ligase [Saprospiraceae bacterium]
MMNANQIRQKFFDFFENKDHKIVPSAPLVIKDDPTLMFTNAGMNQFKDYFLGDKTPEVRRVADTQKCLRVSGKHNDLEEVGRDSYHHTMFEMLGNWSFGDYFKKEAIDWAWELLVTEFGLDPDRIYATVFGGDENEGLGRDEEAAELWEKHLPKEHILYCGKEDNFWEMGDVGPCGPCSELHIDLRPDEERAKLDGATLVNMDDPMVIEIWNLVFIQFNRRADRSLTELPEKHIDTGMGFERLCMAMQGKYSNYDTDVFTPFIKYIEEKTGVKYTNSYDPSAMTDIAMRVLVDHLRAVSFAIADGELPSNNGAGYVIRRILRRAVRYYYSFLNMKEPFLNSMVQMLADKFENVFPELKAQYGFVSKVILEEEKSFLRTLEGGLKRINTLELTNNNLDGKQAFELYDTYGFPIDLTRLIADEKGWTIDEPGFKAALQEQKERGRADAKRETGDWEIVTEDNDVEFVGYDDHDVMDARILKYRTLVEKKKPVYQLVLSKTPFYAEGGGQVGDTGTLLINGETINVLDTKKENNLTIHFVDRLPENMSGLVEAVIDSEKRALTENNHTATHLLHAALKQVLGSHVQQKGSLVKDEYLRFDFSHFQRMTSKEIAEVEQIVNKRIRENISLEEHRSIPIEDAKDAGATMLFGEKYGDHVRMITFDADFSRELCGGCHVSRTGQIGFFKLVSEGGISAGVRRIEAITADRAESYINSHLSELNTIKTLFKNPKNTIKSVEDLQEENKALRKEIESLMAAQASNMQGDLIASAKEINGVKLITKRLEGMDNKTAKTLAFNVSKELDDSVVMFGIVDGTKIQLMLLITEELTKSKDLHAGNIIRELAKEVQGGGGGQSFFATAGGKNPDGLGNAFSKLEEML